MSFLTPSTCSDNLAIGIHFGHDASVAVCSSEGVVFTVAEERLSRIKHHLGFPSRALVEALRYCEISPKAIRLLAFSHEHPLYRTKGEIYAVPMDGTKILLKHKNTSDFIDQNSKYQCNKMVGPTDELTCLKNNLPRLNCRWEAYKERHWSRQADLLQDLGLLDPHITHYYIAHHRSHASAAYRLSGLRDACVITIDGMGDGLSASINRGLPNGGLELLRTSHFQDSPGLFYQAVTEALGFIPVDGEFKTMGLAAYGNEDEKNNPFASVIQVEDGVFHSNIKWSFRNYNMYNPERLVPNPLLSVAETVNFRKIVENLGPSQTAYYAQRHLEDNLVRYIQNATNLCGTDNIAAAGGVMLNVKANAFARDQLAPSQFYIYPDAIDSGLSVGAALESLYQEGYWTTTRELESPYLGTSYTDREITQIMKEEKWSQSIDVTPATVEGIVQELISGKAIGVFRDRMEIGPRALGNRSVLADARSVSIKDRINLALKGRERFVPFAPVILEDEACNMMDDSFVYKYMTFAAKATSTASDTVPAIVHVDDSMRPQVVTPSTNPWLYQLLKAYSELTGVGVLLNTSFNRHGLPIVESPANALEHLVNNWVDGLVIGSYYCRCRSKG